MAENFTVFTNKKAGEAANAAAFNSRHQEIDDTIEGLKAGSTALPSPDIPSFANAQHDHEDAAGGGLLTLDALDSEDATDGYALTAGGDGTVTFAPSELPTSHREGLNIIRVGDDKLVVSTGSAIIRGTTINKSVMTPLQPSAGGDWIDQASQETSAMWIWVYVNANGDIRLHDVAPNYSAPYPENRLCTMRVNEAGWDGSEGAGLDETTIGYDDGAGNDPDGIDNIPSGAYALVYTDSTYEQGRGKGDGASGSKNYQSVMQISSIDTDTKTLDVSPGYHHIALNDNDYIVVVEDGFLDYRKIGSTWWFALGAIWNNSSGNLSTQRVDHMDIYDRIGGANYTTTSTTKVPVDSTNMALEIIVRGREVALGFSAVGWVGYDDSLFFTVKVDDSDLTNDGMVANSQPSAGTCPRIMNFSFQRHQPSLPINLDVPIYPGNHTFTLMWKTLTGSAASIYAGGTPAIATSPQFWVRERRNQ